MPRNELREIGERVLRDAGAADIRYSTTGGGHGRLRFCAAGREHNVIFAGTSSDWRAGRNLRAFIRRTLRQLEGT